MSKNSDDGNGDKVLLKLRDIRRAKGMSLSALAEKVGIDYQRVGRMERGETQMTIDMLNKMSKILHVPITELLNEDVTNVEKSILQNTTPNKSINLIPMIYEKLDSFCSKHAMECEPSIKVHLATVMFKAVEEMRINLKDDEDMVKVLFQVLDAIFERLVLTKDS